MLDLLDQSVSELPQVGERRKFLLSKIGIHKVRDLLMHFPYKFVQESDIVEEGEIVLALTVLRKHKLGKIWAIQAETKNKEQVEIPCFQLKQLNIFQIGRSYKIFGILEYKQRWVLLQPRILHSQYQIMPVYRTSISDVILNKAINEVIDKLPFDLPIYEGVSLKQALKHMHNGSNKSGISVFKYLEAKLFVQLFSNKERRGTQSLDKNFMVNILNALPFELTQDQKNTIENIIKDLESDVPMRHLVFGEVGCGKTVIALVTALMMMRIGYNVALLAPTTTLAQQHADWIIPFIETLGFKGVLLISNTKKNIRENIRIGAYNLVIGTHALLHETVQNLGLVIVDEMHRFGVLQRAKLLDESVRKDLLMLSATPIPRSLNILLKNFMSSSMIEQSVFKKQIITSIIQISTMPSLVEKLKNSAKKAYWVLPSINDTDDYKGVCARFDELSKQIPNVYLLHGKMKDKQKLEVIQQFREAKQALLVATTIVEIGLDIPDADIMIIENAQRFGLAQLHQLRGRVGRHGQPAHCILISGGKHTTQRLQYMKEYADGFSLAKKDMELRGVGEFIGTKQHGKVGTFNFLQLPDDLELLNQAKKDTRLLPEIALLVGSGELRH